MIDQESMDRIRFDNTYYRTADRHHEQYGQLNGRIIEAGNYEGRQGRQEGVKDQTKQTAQTRSHYFHGPTHSPNPSKRNSADL